MQTAHSRATKLDALAPGEAFRFHFRGEAAIGFKAQFAYGTRGDAALVLTSTNALEPGALLSDFDVGDVVALAGVKIIPSTQPNVITQGKGNFAEPGEIELHGNQLLFVTKPHGDDRITYRVDVQTGDIDRSSGAAPVEIYSEWSIQDAGQTLYEHKLTLPDPVAIDQLPTNTIIEFRAYNDGKGYASAMGYHDIGPAQRPGYCRMRRDIGKVADAPCPQDFTYEIIQ